MDLKDFRYNFCVGWEGVDIFEYVNEAFYRPLPVIATDMIFKGADELR